MDHQTWLEAPYQRLCGEDNFGTIEFNMAFRGGTARIIATTSFEENATEYSHIKVEINEMHWSFSPDFEIDHYELEGHEIDDIRERVLKISELN